MMVFCTALPAIQRGVIPEQTELVCDEGPDRLWDLHKTFWEVAKVKQGFQQRRYCIPIDITAKPLGKLKLGGVQEKMFHQFFVLIGSSETRIVSFHRYLLLKKQGGFPKFSENRK